MFSGIGGFELGIGDKATCVGFSEIDKYAIEVYEKHFPTHRNYGNATTINTNDLPDFDLLVGGFPCQAFSIAGNREGFNDTRGTLFFDVARILKDKMVRCVVLENVKGLLSHDNGITFQTILTILTDIGYHVQWQVLNSKDFGVPQNRERVFIVGHLGGRGRSEVFPVGRSNNQIIKQINSGVRETERVYDETGLSPTLNTMQGGQRQPKICVPVLTPERPEKRQNGRRFKTDGEPAFTLTAQDRHGIFDGYRIRKLTPLECERLQGFPDNWTVGHSDSQRYKMCGNAVTVTVVKSLMEKLLEKNWKQI